MLRTSPVLQGTIITGAAGKLSDLWRSESIASNTDERLKQIIREEFYGE